MTAVLDLVELAALGLGVNRTLRPSWTGLLTPYHFKGSHVAQILFQNLELEQAYKYEIVDLDDVTFFMIRDNVTVARHQMDHILYKRPKFLCINDNMNHSHPDHPQIVDAIQKLLSVYYPIPSSFELPPGIENEFLHLDDMHSFFVTRKHKWRVMIVGYVFLTGIILFGMFVVCQIALGRYHAMQRRRVRAVPEELQGNGPGVLFV